MLTTPISTPHFHSRVLALISSHLSLNNSTGISNGLALPAPIIPPFEPVDTPLTPGDTVSQLVGYSSPWIDISSPDPLIADISRQVLTMEVSYAGFCGVSTIVVPGPKQYSNSRGDANGSIQYARAIHEALNLSGFVYLAVHLPMYYYGETPQEEILGDLAPFARENTALTGESAVRKEEDLFSTWDSWNVIRSVCNYSSRLSVGKNAIMSFFSALIK